MTLATRRSLALLGALALVVLGIFFARRFAGSTPSSSAARTGETASPSPPPPPSPSPVRDGSTALPPAAAPASARPAGAGASDPTLETVRRVVAENSGPGRMVFLDLVLDRSGLRLVGATGAAGRAKPGGTRTGFGFVHYEVFGAGGDLLLSGSVEDPTRRRIEHPAATDDGRIASTVQFSDEGPLAVRLPGEIAAARIVFFREKNPLAPGAGPRENLGEFHLRPSP